MIALLALVAAAQASLPPEANVASTALAQCAVGEAQARASAPDPAAAVANMALAACAPQQQRLWDALAAVVGSLNDEDKNRFVERLRTRLVRLVNERRGLVPREQNEATAAGDCVRGRAPAVAARPIADEEAVTDLLNQCRAESDALYASLVRDRGEASADRIMPGVRTTLRTLALEQIQRARDSRRR